MVRLIDHSPCRDQRCTLSGCEGVALPQQRASRNPCAGRTHRLLSEAGGLQQLECDNCYLHVGGSPLRQPEKRDRRRVLFGPET
jgi:hypothetical protein